MMNLRLEVLALLKSEATRRDATPLNLPSHWKVPLPSGPRLHPPATDAMIEAFIARTAIQVPHDLCEWWKTCNGARIANCLFGIDNGDSQRDVYRFYELFPVWRQLKWIPIAGDGCGNYYVQATHHDNTTRHPILFVEPILGPETPQYIVASGIWQFLFFVLTASEFSAARSAAIRAVGDRAHRNSFWWPFDRERVLAVDPEIAAYTHVRFPWTGGQERG